MRKIRIAGLKKMVFFCLLPPISLIVYFIRFLNNVSEFHTSINLSYLKTRDNKKIAVHYTENYSTAALVVHGYMSSSKRSILKYQQYLDDIDIDIVALDLRNHGLSQLSLPIVNGYEECKDVITALKWISTKWQEKFVIATSMGVYSSIYALHDMNPSNTYYPSKLCLGSFGVDTKIGMTNYLHYILKIPLLLSQYIVVLSHILAPKLFERDVITNLNSIPIPILIVHGTKDNLYPPKLIQPILQKKIGSDVEYLVVNNSHSELWQSKKYLDKLSKFITV